MNLESNKKIWRYGAIVVGIKNKCRKSDRHATNKDELGSSTDEKPSEEKAKELALQWANKNFKNIQKITATATLWTILDDRTERWEPFEESHNLKWTIQ